MSSEYQIQFREARQHIHELEAQVQVYTQLSEDIAEANKKQMELSMALSKVQGIISVRVTRNKEEHNKWQRQHGEWKEKIEENEQRTAEAVEERNKMAANYDEVIKAAKEAKELLEREESSHKRTLEELQSVSKDIVTLGSKCNQVRILGV